MFNFKYIKDNAQPGSWRRGYDYHKKCVKAYQNGFADTAGLAQHSYIRGYLNEDDVLNLKWYLFNMKKYPDFNIKFRKEQFNSLKDDIIEKIMQDPLCRELLVLTDSDNPYFLKNINYYITKSNRSKQHNKLKRLHQPNEQVVF